MTRTGKRFATLSLLLLALLPSVFFAYKGLHSRPYSDDMIRIGLASEIGIWEMMHYHRETWNSEYTNFLLIGMMAPLGAAAPAVFSLVMIALAFAAFGWLVDAAGRCMNMPMRRELVVALASLMVAATIFGLPDPVSFCWLSAAADYILPVILFLLGIAIAVEIAPRLRDRVRLLLAAAATALLSFMNAGFGEMYLVFHLPMVALVAVFVFLFQRGPKRRIFLVLSLAAALGALASLIAQLSTPGIAYRSVALHLIEPPATPTREPALLLSATLDLAMGQLDNARGFAAFMLSACACLYATLNTGNSSPCPAAELRRVRAARSPVALCLIVQLLFVPILWTQQSDNIQVLGRFSIAYFSVVIINLLTIAALCALLKWPGLLVRLFSKRNGAIVYCCFVLLAVCLIFTVTQTRDMHYRPFSFLLVTAVMALYMLAGQLQLASADRRLQLLWRLSVFATSSAVLMLTWFSGVVAYATGVVFTRNFAWLSFMLVFSGMLWGFMLGVLIRREYERTQADGVWLRLIKLLALLVAFAIGLGIMAGEARGFSLLQMKTEVWDAKHEEIISLRDAGDSSVYTKRFLQGYLVCAPFPFKSKPLNWTERAFYNLEYSLSEDPYAPKNMASR